MPTKNDPNPVTSNKQHFFFELVIIGTAQYIFCRWFRPWQVSRVFMDRSVGPATCFLVFRCPALQNSRCFFSVSKKKQTSIKQNQQKISTMPAPRLVKLFGAQLRLTEASLRPSCYPLQKCPTQPGLWSSLPVQSVGIKRSQLEL